eukprot:248183-Chlamydomonas_euryale.AAC.5
MPTNCKAPVKPARAHRLEALVVKVDVGDGCKEALQQERVHLLVDNAGLFLGVVRQIAEPFEAVDQQVLQRGDLAGAGMGGRPGAELSRGCLKRGVEYTAAVLVHCNKATHRRLGAYRAPRSCRVRKGVHRKLQATRLRWRTLAGRAFREAGADLLAYQRVSPQHIGHTQTQQN